MAQAPQAKGITLELPAVDKDAASEEKVSQLHSAFAALVDQLQLQLNPFMTDTQTALLGGISSQNIQRQTKVITVATTSFPFSLTISLPVRPSRVHIDQIVTKSGSPPPDAPSAANWRMLDTKTMEISSMPGLAANSIYDVTLSIE